jgi:hypothetical protein
MSPRMAIISADRQSRWTATPQGQEISPILTHHDAPWTEMSVMNIVMSPGKVSNPHEHDGVVTPLIYLSKAGGRGVATLLGDELEELVWIRPGEWGSIGHVPHMAIYPRAERPEEARMMGDAHGIEIRNAGHVLMHTTPRPDLWPIAYRRVEEHGLLDRVTWPTEVLEMISAAGQPVNGRYADIVRQPYGADLPSGEI